MNTSTLVCTAMVFGLLGCARGTDDRTPRGTVKLFLSTAQESASDPEASKRLIGLLAASTRTELRERARRASEVGGRNYRPDEMLVVRFALAAEPDRIDVREQGPRATAELHLEGGPPARLDLVREEGRWRVVLPLGGEGS